MSTKILDKSGLAYFWTKIKAYVAGLLSSKADDSAVVHIAGTETITGTKTLSSVNTITYSDTAAGNTKNILYGKIAANDYFRVLVGGASNAGYLELATADDGNEPIYVRQYKGTFATLQRTATLLDGSGNTAFPGTVTASGFIGNVTGNCSGSSGSTQRYVGAGNYADIVQTFQSDNENYRSCTIRCTNGDGFNEIVLGAHNESNAAPGGIAIRNTNGTLTATAPTPALATDSSTKIATTAWVRTATGNFACNAATASSAAKLTTARKINGVSFDGSADVTLTAVVSSASRSADIAANGTFTVPSYTVGKSQLLVYLDGCLSRQGDGWSEVGTAGAASTTIKFNQLIPADMEIVVRVN